MLWMCFLKYFSRISFTLMLTETVMVVLMSASLQWLCILGSLFIRIFDNAFLSEFLNWRFYSKKLFTIRSLIAACADFEEALKSVLGYSAVDLGIELRGLTLCSNFCPTNPIVHSLKLYCQHPENWILEGFSVNIRVLWLSLLKLWLFK